MLGTTLDRGIRPSRWERWRPTVDMCRHDDLLIDRLELIDPGANQALVETVVEDIAHVSPETKVNVTRIALDDWWDFEQVYAALHGFACSQGFDQEQSDHLVHITTGTHVAQICMFLLTESRHLPARLLQLSPPKRPLPHAAPGAFAIIDLDLSRYDRLASRFAAEQADSRAFLKRGIETKSARFNKLIDRIEQVAISSREPMLLSGPTGAGKSLLAERIYELKRQRGQLEGAFVPVNCATLRGDAAMSTLFGHVKGAYTGALSNRAGLLLAADRGMLFLDEIGELGGDEQAMLLGAIERKRFLPVGSDSERESRFQLLAGTNRDLDRAVAEGRFRADLLARINLWSFALPGLAQRREDIAPNLDFELSEWAGRGGQRVSMTDAARKRFMAFATAPEASWPGNFRDFSAAVTRMATLATLGRIGLEQVDDEILRLRCQWQQQPGDIGVSLQLLLGVERFAELDRFDRAQLADVVVVCRASPSLSAAGRVLFAVSRKKKKSSNDADRLRKYLARFGLDWAALRDPSLLLNAH